MANLAECSHSQLTRQCRDESNMTDVTKMLMMSPRRRDRNSQTADGTMRGPTDRKTERDAGRAARSVNSAKTGRLTPKERELARLILAGCSNRQIAQESRVSVKTVKNQLTTLFEKAGVASRLQLALFVMKNHDLIRD
jgi:DNA-binding NarL/FixJ family response regulator